MPYYGDISGDLRGLLNGACDICVVAVVAGPRHDCQRCPKQTVRNVTAVDEARWNELKPVQKRRFMDCLDDNIENLEFGYATFSQDQLHSLQYSHCLYQEETPPVWDIALRGFAYTEILHDLVGDGERAVFYPDQFASTKQQEQLKEVIENYTEDISVSPSSSKQRPGIQAADCFAGCIREEKLGGEPWSDHLSTTIDAPDKSPWALMQLEHRLSEM